MKRSRILIIALGTIIVLLSSVLAAVVINHELNNSMHLQRVGDFAITKEDGTTLDGISWGNFYPGDSKNSHDILGSYIVVVSNGAVPLEFRWYATGLDRTQWSLTCTWGGDAKTDAPEGADVFWIDNTYNSITLYRGGYLSLTLTSLNASNTVEQDLSFTLTIEATKLF